MTSDERRALWFEHWALLEQQQSLVANYGDEVEKLGHRIDQTQSPAQIKIHQRMTERYVFLRSRLQRRIDQFLFGASRQ